MIEINLDNIMIKKRWTNEQLSKATGLTEPAISKIKNQKNKGINFKSLDKLCTALKCNPGDLLKYKSKD